MNFRKCWQQKMLKTKVRHRDVDNTDSNENAFLER